MEEPEKKGDTEQKKEEKQPTTEVIAQKARGYLAAVIFTLVFGVFMAFFGALLIVLGIVEGGPVTMYIVAAVMALGGVGLSVYSAIATHKIRLIPKVIIFREGDTVSFFVTKTVSFSCKTEEITNVSYYQAYGRGQTRPWGTLVVYFGARQLQLVYIRDVVAAHNRLFALMIEKKNEKKEDNEQKTEETGENDGEFKR